jgi:hypothetical protein
MNLNKDISSWAKVQPDSVMSMGGAAVKNVLTMALEDIQRLGRENKRLKRIADRWEPTIGEREAMRDRLR